jgi:hypothetical protein
MARLPRTPTTKPSEKSRAAPYPDSPATDGRPCRSRANGYGHVLPVRPPTRRRTWPYVASSLRNLLSCLDLRPAGLPSEEVRRDVHVVAVD